MTGLAVGRYGRQHHLERHRIRSVIRLRVVRQSAQLRTLAAVQVGLLARELGIILVGHIESRPVDVRIAVSVGFGQVGHHIQEEHMHPFLADGDISHQRVRVVAYRFHQRLHLFGSQVVKLRQPHEGQFVEMADALSPLESGSHGKIQARRLFRLGLDSEPLAFVIPVFRRTVTQQGIAPDELNNVFQRRHFGVRIKVPLKNIYFHIRSILNDAAKIAPLFLVIFSLYGSKT